MKKILAVLALAVSAPAYAGIGATAFLGSTSDGAVSFAPSLDYRASGILAQVHLLDLIGNLTNKSITLNADVTGIAMKRKVAAGVEGVVMPGGNVVLDTPTSFSGANWRLAAETRLGAEVKEGMGIGVYVVPQLGISNFTGSVGLAYGGTLQVSAWIGKEGGSTGGDNGKGQKNK